MPECYLRLLKLGTQGQRLSILKAVYGYKLRDEIPIEQGHWVPPSESA